MNQLHTPQETACSSTNIVLIIFDSKKGSCHRNIRHFHTYASEINAQNFYTIPNEHSLHITSHTMIQGFLLQLPQEKKPFQSQLFNAESCDPTFKISPRYHQPAFTPEHTAFQQVCHIISLDWLTFNFLAQESSRLY